MASLWQPNNDPAQYTAKALNNEDGKILYEDKEAILSFCINQVCIGASNMHFDWGPEASLVSGKLGLPCFS